MGRGVVETAVTHYSSLLAHPMTTQCTVFPTYALYMGAVQVRGLCTAAMVSVYTQVCWQMTEVFSVVTL